MNAKWIYRMIGLGLILAMTGCAAPASPVTPAATLPPAATPTSAAPATPPAEDRSPAETAAKQALADWLGISVEDIEVTGVDEVQWPDACLGVTTRMKACAAVVTPGYRILLEAKGAPYEYHTDLDGQSVVLASGKTIPGADSPLGGHSSGDPAAAQQAALDALAGQTGLPAGEIQVVDSQPVDWPDACLGVQIPGLLCAQIVTPGYRVTLAADGHTYEYHTNQDGSTVQSASVALSWQRSGGFAGFSDSLTIFLPADGRVIWSSQQGGSQANRLSGLLTAAEMEQWKQWLDTFGVVQLEVKDPATADAMTVTLNFNGFGTGQPDEAQQQALLTWAQDVFTRLQK